MRAEVQEQVQGQVKEQIHKPQQLPPPSLVPRSPSLFSSPPHRALAKLPFLPDHIAHCLQQTFWHLTEFHLKPEKGEGSGGHRGPLLLRQEFTFRILAAALHTASKHSQYLSPISPTGPQAPGGGATFVCSRPGGQGRGGGGGRVPSTVLPITRTQ